MSAPGQLVLKLRLEHVVTREVIASATGLAVERQAVIEAADSLPTYHERRAYARYFHFASVQDFDDAWRGTMVQLSRGETNRRIPVINFAPAGSPQDYNEQYMDSGIGYAYIDPPPGIVGPNLFAFIIAGDSMEPDYPEGYYAICRPTPSDQIAEGAAVLIRFGASRDYTCTFKKCCRLNDAEVELRPVNPDHPSIRVRKDDIVRMSPVIAILARKQLAAEEYSRVVGDDVQYSADRSNGDE